MYSKNANFQHETVNFEFAIATANRLKPAFVVITGDLINDAGNAAQTAEYKRIAAKLDPAIKLYSLPGNHDVQNEPTAESLALYRERFGPDYYTFQSGGLTGIVLNSNLEKGTKNVPQEAAKMEAWFKSELEKAKAGGAKQIIVFQHIPLFRKDPNEPEVYENMPVDVRQRYLKLMHENGVKWVFAGHQHQNEEGSRRRVTGHSDRTCRDASARSKVRDPHRDRHARGSESQVLRFRRNTRVLEVK